MQSDAAPDASDASVSGQGDLQGDADLADRSDSPVAEAGNCDGAPLCMVSGVVVGRFGEPIGQAHIAIGGQAAVTDANGSFTFTNISVPYDAVVRTSSSTTLYVGLHLQNPRLGTLAYGSGGALSQGVLQGALPPTGQSQVAAFFAPDSPAPVVGAVGPTTAPTNYVFDLNWWGSATESGAVYILQYLPVQGALVTAQTYQGYAAFRATVAARTTMDSGTTTVDAPSLQSVQTGVISATLSPTGVANSVYAVMRPAGSTARIVASEIYSSIGSSVSAAVPVVPGATYFVQVEGPSGHPTLSAQYPINTSVRKSVMLGGSVDITLPQGSMLSQPVDGAVGIDGTTVFSWTAPAGHGVYDFFVQPVIYEGVPDATPAAWDYQGSVSDVLEVITESPTATLSVEVLDSGMGLMSGRSYYWGVRRYDDRLSVDDAAGPRGIDWDCQLTANAPDGEAMCTSSEVRTFVTK